MVYGKPVPSPEAHASMAAPPREPRKREPTPLETLFTVERNIGDGNCALYGVAKMLANMGINTTHSLLRTEMCNELAKNKEKYWDYVFGKSGGQLRDERFNGS